MVLYVFYVLTATCLTFVASKTAWSSSPATWSDIIREAYPVGNGKLGGSDEPSYREEVSNIPVAMPFGLPGADKVNLNVDSLWSGGPFMSDVSCSPEIEIAKTVADIQRGQPHDREVIIPSRDPRSYLSKWNWKKVAPGTFTSGANTRRCYRTPRKR